MIARAKPRTNRPRGKAEAEVIPAVGYVRMSDRKQDASPEQQRREIIALAAREGYCIIRWYEDLGISGDATEKRMGFQRMILDAQEKGDFVSVLVWDSDRFGRFDSLEAGYWIHPLRKSGVSLVTVNQGAVDWHSQYGRFKSTIDFEGAHDYINKLSKNICRGRINAMRDNTVAPVPVWGYDRLFFDQHGREMTRVRYGEKFSKPKGWTSKLDPAADGESAAMVQWMFQTIDDDDSVRSIVSELTARGIPSPRGKGWTWTAVHFILTNPTYAGMRAHGRFVGGKYHNLDDGGKIVQGPGKKQHRRREPLFLEKGDHPALVNPDLFERVQRRLSERHTTKEQPRVSAYLLRGVVYCGHCGGKLYGGPGGKKTDEGYSLHYYTCENGAQIGRACCQKYAIRQDHLERYILDVVNQAVSSPEAIAQIREAISRIKTSGGAKGSGATALKGKIRAMDAKITKAAENVLLADSATVPELTKVLDQWRKERAKMQAKLETMEWGDKPDREAIAQRALAELDRLRENLETGEPARVRQAVRGVIKKITLWWKPKPSGKRYRLMRGLIEFERNGNVSPTVR